MILLWLIGLKVASVRVTGVLWDIRRFQRTDSIPVHTGKEGVVLEVRDTTASEPFVCITNKPTHTHTPSNVNK